MPHGCERGKALCSVLQTDIKFLVGFSAAKRKSYCSCSDFFFFSASSWLFRTFECEKVILFVRIFFFLFPLLLHPAHRFCTGFILYTTLVFIQVWIITKLTPIINPYARMNLEQWCHDDVITWFIIDFWIFNFSHRLCTRFEGINTWFFFRRFLSLNNLWFWSNLAES